MGNSVSSVTQDEKQIVQPLIQPVTPVQEEKTIVQETEVKNGEVKNEEVKNEEVKEERKIEEVVNRPPTPIITRKPKVFIHPLIEMINRNCPDAEMIRTLDTFVGKIQVGTDPQGNPIYETVDQMQFIAPVMEVFSYCANNGRKSVVQWLFDNFIPLNVSYDNNFCYFESLRWNHTDITDMIVQHESFYPSMEVLENLISRNKYNLLKKCMTSPHLRGDLQTYRFTFMYYVDNDQFSMVNELLRKIKQRSTDNKIEINDTVYPNPRFAKKTEPVIETVAPVAPIAAENKQEIILDSLPAQISELSISAPEISQPVTVNQPELHYGC